MSYISQVLPSLLDGAAVTLQVFCIVIVLSIPIGAILAFLMQIKFKPLQWLLTLYVWIMRGTPLLLQLIFFYYVLPSVGVVMDRMPAAIFCIYYNFYRKHSASRDFTECGVLFSSGRKCFAARGWDNAQGRCRPNSHGASTQR